MRASSAPAQLYNRLGTHECFLSVIKPVLVNHIKQDRNKTKANSSRKCQKMYTYIYWARIINEIPDRAGVHVKGIARETNAHEPGRWMQMANEECCWPVGNLLRKEQDSRFIKVPTSFNCISVSQFCAPPQPPLRASPPPTTSIYSTTARSRLLVCVCVSMKIYKCTPARGAAGALEFVWAQEPFLVFNPVESHPWDATPTLVDYNSFNTPIYSTN